MQIRELKAKDVKLLARALAKLPPESIDRLHRVMIGAQAGGNGDDLDSKMRVGIALIQTIAEITDDLWIWFADLSGMTVAELDEAPFETPRQIIEQLAKQEQFTAFFDSAIRSVSPERPESMTSSNTVTTGPIAS